MSTRGGRGGDVPCASRSSFASPDLSASTIKNQRSPCRLYVCTVLNVSGCCFRRRRPKNKVVMPRVCRVCTFIAFVVDDGHRWILDVLAWTHNTFVGTLISQRLEVVACCLVVCLLLTVVIVRRRWIIDIDSCTSNGERISFSVATLRPRVMTYRRLAAVILLHRQQLLLLDTAHVGRVSRPCIERLIVRCGVGLAPLSASFGCGGSSTFSPGRTTDFAEFRSGGVVVSRVANTIVIEGRWWILDVDSCSINGGFPFSVTATSVQVLQNSDLPSSGGGDFASSAATFATECTQNDTTSSVDPTSTYQHVFDGTVWHSSRTFVGVHRLRWIVDVLA